MGIFNDDPICWLCNEGEEIATHIIFAFQATNKGTKNSRGKELQLLTTSSEKDIVN